MFRSGRVLRQTGTSGGKLGLAGIYPLALTSISGSSLAVEKIIHFSSGNNTITGTLTLPENVKNPPAVLILHGFTDQRNGQKTTYFQEGYLRYASKRWADAGIASLRIDFMGSGENSGNYADTTLESQIEEAKEALIYLRNTGQVIRVPDHLIVGGRQIYSFAEHGLL